MLLTMIEWLIWPREPENEGELLMAPGGKIRIRRLIFPFSAGVSEARSTDCLSVRDGLWAPHRSVEQEAVGHC